jgi:ABC-type lipoprotein release transport system permease subunit
MAVFRYAWRNLWRNKRRTGITLAAVTLNTAILIISYSLMDGIIKHTIDNVTNMVTGEAQIHAESYRGDRSFYKSISNPEKILKIAELHQIGASPRSYGYGLASVGTKSAGALFWGVDPAAEKDVFDLAVNIQDGYFLNNSSSGGIVLGKKLARSLHASVGSEIIVVVQAADGSLGNELYNVRGILKSVGENIDRSAAILHQEDFSELFVSGGRIHEIAMNSKGKMALEEMTAVFNSGISNLEIKNWKELLPAISEMVNVFDVVIWMFGAVFFMAAGLGVMNTMLMATYERMREFGILKAIGTSPLRIVGNMTAEAFLLTIAASVLGMCIGIAGSYFFQEVGIDTSIFAGSFSFSGIAFDPVWRAVISLKVIILPVVTMCITCAAASLYPAIIAARLDPVRAIHHA